MPIATPLPFLLPHRDEVDPAHALQARPDKVDFAIHMLASAGWGWMVDASVSAQTTPDLTVHVDSGVVRIGPDIVGIPASDVVISPDTIAPRFVLVGADRLDITTAARSGTTAHVEVILNPLGSQWRVGDRIVVACSDHRLNTPSTGALITAVGDAYVEYTVGTSGTIATEAATGGVVHVGALHGSPSSTDKPPFSSIPINGFVALAAIEVFPNVTEIDDIDIIDKRSPTLGNVSRVINPTDFPYMARGDGVTYDGDVIEAAAIDAHQRRMDLDLPAGKTFLMTNGTTNKVLTWDFADNLGYSRVKAAYKGAATLLYTAAFPMNTSAVVGDKAIGDPGGRIATFAIEMTNTGKAQGSLIWDGVNLEGPKPKSFIADGEERDAGWAFRMGRRAIVANCSITGFHAGLVYRIDCDHNFAYAVEVSSCWYGAYHSWNQVLIKDSVAGGDHSQMFVELSSNAHSSWAADAAAVIFDSSIVSGHWGTSAYGFSREASPIGDQTLDAAGTYARDATHGEVTINTNVGAVASPWPGLMIDPAFGIKVGDPVDLSKIAALIGGGFHFGLDPAGKSSDLGVVTATSNGGKTLTISMGSYDVTSSGGRGAFAVTGAAISTTTVPASSSIAHVWNLSSWLLQINMVDTSMEGCTVANIFDFAHNSEMNTCYGYWQFHGIEVIGRNTGQARGYAPLAVTSATRKWTRGGVGGELSPADGDVYTTTLLVASGHGIKTGSIIFYDANPTASSANYGTVATKVGSRTASKQLTLTTRVGSGTDIGLIVGTIVTGPGTPANTHVTACSSSGLVLTLDNDITSPAASTFVFLDDAPPIPNQGWTANASRARGKWEVTFTDATHIQFEQVYSTTKAPYTGTTANPYVVTGGGVGQVCSIYCGEMDRNINLTINAQHEGQSGDGQAEVQWVVRRLRDNDIKMSNGVAPRVLTQDGYDDHDSADPCNTIIWAGGSKFRVTHTEEALFKMALCQSNLKDDVELYRTGGFVAGFAAYAATANDFVTLLVEGPSKPKPIDYGGALSTVSFSQGAIMVGDGAAGLEGFVKLSSGAVGESVVGRARSGSAGPAFGIYSTSLRVGLSQGPSSSPVMERTFKVLDDATTLTVGDGKFVFVVPPSLDGKHLISADAFVSVASSSGLPTIQVQRIDDTQDMLATAITIDATEFTSYTAATPSAVGTTPHTLVTLGQRIGIDIDGAGTGAKGLGVILRFQ